MIARCASLIPPSRPDLGILHCTPPFAFTLCCIFRLHVIPCLQRMHGGCVCVCVCVCVWMWGEMRGTQSRTGLREATVRAQQIRNPILAGCGASLLGFRGATWFTTSPSPCYISSTILRLLAPIATGHNRMRRVVRLRQCVPSASVVASGASATSHQHRHASTSAPASTSHQRIATPKGKERHSPSLGTDQRAQSKKLPRIPPPGLRLLSSVPGAGPARLGMDSQADLGRHFYLNKVLEQWAAKPATRMTLRQLIFFGRTSGGTGRRSSRAPTMCGRSCPFASHTASATSKRYPLSS